QKIAASVEDQLLFVDLDAFGVMRGMTVDDIESRLLDETVRKFPLGGRNLVTPIRPPMNGGHKDIAGSLCRRSSRNQRYGAIGEIGQQIDAGLLLTGGPIRGDAAGLRPEGEHDDPSLAHRSQDGGC